ncbi:polymorphic toxin-type HINT domain-containing protein [Micromonospora avicenniae]|uniref:polymorphic toxin-type HINT domain-containing protein n=1 Tax=Micromonospora avicenniae TaxID=1198245 RepID=UPI00332BA096
MNRFLTRDAYGGALADMGLSMDPSRVTGMRSRVVTRSALWSWTGTCSGCRDVANGIWYAAEGNYVDAALSMASAIPLAGNAVAAAKLAKTGKKIADGIDTVKDVEKGVEATVDANKALPTNTPKPKTETPTQPKCNSFVPGTRVLLADGSSKPIEEVKVGDRVLAADVESGDRQSRPVTQLIKGDGVKKLVTIVVDTDGKAGGKTSTIVATDGHRFYLPDSGVWVTAGQLKVGAWLQTSSGTWVQISAIRHETRVQRVHNFTVDGQHTYYVLAGETPVLAHNDACPVGDEVRYNSDELSTAAYNARVNSNSAHFPSGPRTQSPGGNVAVARVEGHDDLIVGFSQGDGYHAEDHIMDQINALKANNKGIGKITDLYSERQPCSVCAGKLPGHLAENARITWPVPWSDNGLMNSVSNEMLARMIRLAAGGRA